MEILTSGTSDRPAPPPPPPPPPLAPLTPPPLGDRTSENRAVSASDLDDDSQLLLSPYVEPRAEDPSPMDILLAAALPDFEVRVPAPAPAPAPVPATEAVAAAVPVAVTEVAVKKKRGRPPKSKEGAGTVAAKRQAVAKGKEEEDVCFICFDGGDLVVCDRRNCPKVYHPSCVKRDASFFQSKWMWNCGWHICSICAKAANYMCYTCTYSLCKVCIRKSNFFCIRGNDGFCETCFKIVMLIESNGNANGEKVTVDFDDKNNWEYLFKLYWLALKKKLTLTVEELNNARTPHKGSAFPRHNANFSKELYIANDRHEASSNSPMPHRECTDISREKPEQQTREPASGECLNKPVIRSTDGGSVDKNSDGVLESEPKNSQWASPVLLEFVSHMNQGDTSASTQLAIQELLLKYVEKNELRDPCNKNEIVCDKMLCNLFGKARMENFEMLNLLKLHFLTEVPKQVEDSHNEVAEPGSAQIDADKSGDAVTCRDEERKNQINVDDYAAIDVHNIKLIYLRHNLIENLLDDMNAFRKNVIGSFVRMRIPDAGQKQTLYRLVPVVGTQTITEKYNFGKKTVDIALEVLNLGGTEILPFDTISNENFTEEECRQLRKTMECGLFKWLKVGVVLEKAKIFRAARVNGWLESERLRLSHLRDLASETGRIEELRRYEEKLPLLSTPEEQISWLNEVPEIHVDPSIDPNCLSFDEETKQMKKDYHAVARVSFSSTEAKELISLGTGCPDASSNLSGTPTESRSLPLPDHSWERGSMKTVNNLVTESANYCGTNGDIPKLQAGNVAASSGQNRGQSVETCASDAAKALVTNGPCNDALNLPSTLKLNNGMSVSKPVSVPCTSSLVNDSAASVDVSQSAECSSTSELVLIRTNKPDVEKLIEAHVTSGRESSTARCELQERSCVHENETDAVKESETQKDFDGESQARVSLLCSDYEQRKVSPPDVYAPNAEGKDSSSQYLHEEKQVSLTSAEDHKASSHFSMASFTSPSLCLNLKSEVEGLSASVREENTKDTDCRSLGEIQKPGPSFLNPDQLKLLKLSASVHEETSKDNDHRSLGEIQKPGPSFVNPDQLKLPKLEDGIESTSTEWSLSPAPAFKPSDWTSMPGTVSGDNQNRSFLSTDSLMTPKAATDSFVLVIPVSNSDDEDTLSKCLEEAFQTIEDMESDAANEEVQVSGNEVKTEMNPELGAPLLGDLNLLDWEPLSPSEGWGAFLEDDPAAEWGALSPVPANTEDLEVFLPVHSNTDLGVLSPVQSNSNACWATPSLGNMDLNVGWEESIPGTSSPIWGSSSPERLVTYEMLGLNADLNLG